MSTYRKLGETLHLELQLGDGNKFPTTRVFADIRELDGTISVAEFELTKNGVGYYSDTAQTMPTDTAIVVTYYIRKANGTSVETKYNPHYLTEIFLRDFTGETIDDNLDGKISNLKPTDMVGSAEADTGISGNLEDSQLIGELDEDTIITGEVDEC